MENDFYTVYLEVPEHHWKLLVDEVIPGKGYSGLLWVDERDGCDCTRLDETFNKARQVLTIEHYYKGNQFNYASPAWFLAAQSIRRHDLSVLGNRIFNVLAIDERSFVQIDWNSFGTLLRRASRIQESTLIRSFLGCKGTPTGGSIIHNDKSTRPISTLSLSHYARLAICKSTTVSSRSRQMH